MSDAQRACAVPFKGKKGYGYDYADLTNVKAAYAEAVAGSVGLAILDECVPIPEAGAGFWLVTTVVHKHSGQWTNTRCPIMWDTGAKVAMQSYGSAETYARRYNRLKLFDLAPSDASIEGDGAGHDPNKAPPQGRPQANNQAPQHRPPQNTRPTHQGNGGGPPQINLQSQQNFSEGRYIGPNDRRR